MSTDTKLTAFLECGSGISGDMMLGALVDAGLPVSRLRQELKRLKVGGYSIRSSRVLRGGIRGTRIEVMTGKSAPLRRWGDVRTVIEDSSLPPAVRKTALGIFRKLFAAEARVHGTTVAAVHLHELGAVDCIVDIVGAALGLHHLGIEKVLASPVNVGGGSVETEHGVLPVPAPATAELLKGVPVRTRGPAFEMTTPTGAAIVATLAAAFGPLPEMELRTIGVGAGACDPDGWPNVLRLFLGMAPAVEIDEEILVLETNIDDMDPRAFEPLSGRLFRRGALDVFLEPIAMKKFRPGVRLTVLCPPASLDTLADTVLEETTTLGIRVYGVGRRILKRRTIRVRMARGTVRAKLGYLRGRLVRVMPEYEDVKRLAEKEGIPFRAALEAARKAARARVASGP